MQEEIQALRSKNEEGLEVERVVQKCVKIKTKTETGLDVGDARRHLLRQRTLQR